MQHLLQVNHPHPVMLLKRDTLLDLLTQKFRRQEDGIRSQQPTLHAVTSRRPLQKHLNQKLRPLFTSLMQNRQIISERWRGRVPGLNLGHQFFSERARRRDRMDHIREVSIGNQAPIYLNLSKPDLVSRLKLISLLCPSSSSKVTEVTRSIKSSCHPPGTSRFFRGGHPRVLAGIRKRGCIRLCRWTY